MTHGPLLKRTLSSTLQAFSDVEWARCLDGRESTGAYFAFIGLNLVLWCSRKQPSFSRSSTKVEYKAVTNTTAEVLWIKVLLRDLGIPLMATPILWCDNIGAMYLSVKILQIIFIPSKDQLADVLTEPIFATRF